MIEYPLWSFFLNSELMEKKKKYSNASKVQNSKGTEENAHPL
jgi:hypothetical protein